MRYEFFIPPSDTDLIGMAVEALERKGYKEKPPTYFENFDFTTQESYFLVDSAKGTFTWNLVPEKYVDRRYSYFDDIFSSDSKIVPRRTHEVVIKCPSLDHPIVVKSDGVTVGCQKFSLDRILDLESVRRRAKREAPHFETVWEIKIPSPEISKEVQKLLFKYGYSWSQGKNVSYINEKYLCLNSGGKRRITYSNSPIAEENKVPLSLDDIFFGDVLKEEKGILVNLNSDDPNSEIEVKVFNDHWKYQGDSYTGTLPLSLIDELVAARQKVLA